ncbi:MAG: fluoride efflux transporter CrcB [Lachnospiraceae bacterium]|jgi:CrcB protein|nr:fluoride efflux transporter CrcB [Lachnospiraceae bacterium]
MIQLLAVGVGGFLGACSRFGIGKLMVQYNNFPLATLISNVLAGFLIGVIIGIERETSEIPKHIKNFLTTGFLGGLSTFSTFSLETVTLIEKGNLTKAAANTFLNVALCFVAVFLGIIVVRIICNIIKV